MKKKIEPQNNKGEAHGFWVIYWTNGNEMAKGHFNRNNQVGYWKHTNPDVTYILHRYIIR